MYPRERTYEERTRYRNPWPAPILTEPEYLAHSRPHQQTNANINNNTYNDNSRQYRLSSAAQAPTSPTRNSRDIITGLDDLNIDIDMGVEQRRFAPYDSPSNIAQLQQQQVFQGNEAARMEVSRERPNFYSSVRPHHHHRRRRLRV